MHVFFHKFMNLCILSMLAGLVAEARQRYNYASREFMASFGEATSTVHARQIVSREITVGMGSRTSKEHIRNIISREFTVGIGQEKIDIFPKTNNLAGIVTLENGCSFVQDQQNATATLEIFFEDKLVATTNAKLYKFTYQWDTTFLPDGVYTVILTVSRDGMEDAIGSRKYTLINQKYEGSQSATINYTLRRGWTLINIPFRVAPPYSLELSELNPICCNFMDNMNYYSFEDTDFAHGTVVWVYSPGKRDCSLKTEYYTSAPSFCTFKNKAGWQFVGISGGKSIELDCEALGISSVWRWNGKTMELIPPHGGVVRLAPKIGYLIYKQF
ncbi:MAG: hypothetical protein J6X55_02955 [Victivallales bacterium]|nr:hypothetical protein [Victivallales bacterium]